LPFARGTEAVYKVYAETFKGEDHLREILRKAQIIVGCTCDGPPPA